MGKVKAEFSTSSILKKNSTKIVLKKTMWGNIVTIHSVLKKKTTKQNSQPAQYEKNKIDKDHFGKKKRKKFIKKRKKAM